MTSQALLASDLALAGTVAAVIAVVHERRMHRHRQPGVTYAQATLRKDGGWRRSELFTPEGLRQQARAARFGMMAAGLWVLALVSFVLLA